MGICIIPRLNSDYLYKMVTYQVKRNHFSIIQTNPSIQNSRVQADSGAVVESKELSHAGHQRLLVLAPNDPHHDENQSERPLHRSF